MRLVANQSSKKISDLFSEHLKKLCPESCTIKVTEHHGGEPCIVNTNTKGYKAAFNAFKEVWNKLPWNKESPNCQVSIVYLDDEMRIMQDMYGSIFIYIRPSISLLNLNTTSND